MAGTHFNLWETDTTAAEFVEKLTTLPDAARIFFQVADPNAPKKGFVKGITGANLKAALLSTNFKGVWAANTAYSAGEIVVHSGNVYLCKIANTDSTFTAANWFNLTDTGDPSIYRGAWAANTAYSAGEIVVHGGNVYLCKTANSDATFTAAKWFNLSDTGSASIYRGMYVANTAYSAGEIVVHSGNVYLCSTANTDSTFTAANWFNLTDTGDPSIYRGAWAANTSYAAGEIVVRSSNVYLCKTANSDATFTAAKWFNLSDTGSASIYRGMYVANTAYSAGEIVVHSGNVYLCSTANTDSAFTDSNWFNLTDTGSASIYRGTWTANTAYAAGEIVVRSGNVYLCKTANSDSTFTAAKWFNLSDTGSTSIYKGAWTANTAYSAGEIVVHSENVYLCKTANTDSTFTPAKWFNLSDATVVLSLLDLPKIIENWVYAGKGSGASVEAKPLLNIEETTEATDFDSGHLSVAANLAATEAYHLSTGHANTPGLEIIDLDFGGQALKVTQGDGQGDLTINANISAQSAGAAGVLYYKDGTPPDDNTDGTVINWSNGPNWSGNAYTATWASGEVDNADEGRFYWIRPGTTTNITTGTVRVRFSYDRITQQAETGILNTGDGLEVESAILQLKVQGTTLTVDANGIKLAESVARYRGQWTASTAYIVGDAVVHAGNIYLCKTGNSESTFTEAKWFNLTAAAFDLNTTHTNLTGTDTTILTGLNDNDRVEIYYKETGGSNFYTDSWAFRFGDLSGSATRRVLSASGNNFAVLYWKDGTSLKMRQGSGLNGSNFMRLLKKTNYYA